jgi:selenide, water dikinase
LPPGDLAAALAGLAIPTNENVLVGPGTADDAGVYRISDDLALIQTVDFFTPIVDDPYDFGRIAAANALSDVYAMGGVPKTAMNLVAFPLGSMYPQILRDILAGGISILEESGTVLLGGHSVEDDELKYGLSVTGFIHPDKILANQGLMPGDRLILTKPLGTGVMNTAVKAGLASDKQVAAITALMATLNRDAAAVMTRFPITACTDVTGFGLLGHLAEMVAGTRVGVQIFSDRVPLISGALDFAGMGLVPGGAFRNRKFRESMVAMDADLNPALRDMLFDPQTSGGLLMGCPNNRSQELVDALRAQGIADAAVIGEVTDQGRGIITIL